MTAPGAPVPGDTPTELLAIAAELDSIAAFQDRPGAMAEVEALAARLRAAAASEGAEIEELRAEAMRLRSELTEARADRPCADEDCRAFRDGMTVWWGRLHDLVAAELPPQRPGSPAQIVRAITAALAASGGVAAPDALALIDELLGCMAHAFAGMATAEPELSAWRARRAALVARTPQPAPTECGRLVSEHSDTPPFGWAEPWRCRLNRDHHGDCSPDRAEYISADPDGEEHCG